MLRELFGAGDRLDWPQVPIPRLVETLASAAREVESRPADREGLYIRVSEAWRAMDLEPPALAAWDAACRGKSGLEPATEEIAPTLRRALDEEGWKRLHLVVASLGDAAAWELVRQRAVEHGAGRVTSGLMVAFAAWTEKIRIAALLQNPFRVEEFARKWVDALGGRVQGESETKARKRLREVDSSRQLEGLDQAQRRRDEERRQEELRRQRERDEYERFQRE